MIHASVLSCFLEIFSKHAEVTFLPIYGAQKLPPLKPLFSICTKVSRYLPSARVVQLLALWYWFGYY